MGCENFQKKQKFKIKFSGWAFLSILLSSCAADFDFSSAPNTTRPTTDLSRQNDYAASLQSAKFTFNYSDSYTITSPNQTTGCAGDIKNFYDAINLSSSSTPLKLETSISDPTETIRPSFIKNISLDITDANASLSTNTSSSCSFGVGNTASPPSSCATFDYGAIGGIPSLLGGSVILMGGIQNTNYTGIQTSFTSHGLAVSCGFVKPRSTLSDQTGYNICEGNMYALGVNLLPSTAAGSDMSPGLTTATGPISTWAKISSASGYTGPPGKVGASVAYDDNAKKILLFGGSSPLTGMTSSGQGSATYETWVFDLSTQKWSVSSTSSVSVDSSINTSKDIYPGTSGTGGLSGTLNQPLKGDGGRALFGFAAVSGMGISSFGSNEFAGNTAGSSPLDTTDRIAIVGGYCPAQATACQDVHLLNPTFAPEYINALTPSSAYPVAKLGYPSRQSYPVQYLDSYYQRLASTDFPNNYETSYTNPSIMSPKATSFSPPNGFPYPSPSPSPSTMPDTAVSFGMVALNNNYPGSVGLGPTSTQPGAGYLLTVGGFYGYRTPAGAYNIPSTSPCTDLLSCGGMQIFTPWFDTTAGWNSNIERIATNISHVSTILNGLENTPGRWSRIQEGLIADTKTTPWFGGGVLLKGLNIPIPAATYTPTPVPADSGPYTPYGASLDPASLNQVVYFGGSDCQNYLTDATACPQWPTAYNPGAYWIFGVDPAYSMFTGGLANAHPPSVPMGATQNTTFPYLPPRNVGMASARGADPTGNPIIVAWGGMTQPTLTDDSGYIYYLYNNSGVPTWATYQIAAGSFPSGLANSAMVYSHVTGKFYIFGGYSPTAGVTGDTWELSISSSGTSVSCGKATSATCVFSWRLMNSNSGLTCYSANSPNNLCPASRRSHRMVEVNYNYFNAPSEPDCTDAAQPCSFGIFMQGGAITGLDDYMPDRWMFDPTANGGSGHWQQIEELPPRTLAAMASVTYTIPTTGSVAHRAVLFGGETGMHNTIMATAPGKENSTAAGYFVPPTLGDTWIYDFGNNSWNRVNLYGARYENTADPSGMTETTARGASDISDSTTQRLTPPPLSGGIMVTRTLSKENHSTSDTPKSLRIPEIFLFGGRTKDGKYHPLDQVYKFCIGSTGEKPYPSSMKGTPVTPPDDASCDSFDPDENPLSLSPVSGYYGRWLFKNPQSTDYLASIGTASAALGYYMGAGTYDSSHDLIVMYGGLTPTAITNTAITDSSTRTVDDDGAILEYTPPSALGAGSGSGAPFHGSWNLIRSCAETPEVPIGRYGHTLAYDSLNQSLVLIGGYDQSGTLLVQTQTALDGSTYEIPEIWTATRIDTALTVGIPSKNIPPISGPPTSIIPCYFWSKVTLFGNDITNSAQYPPFGGLAHASGIYVPSSGYNTGYYTTLDNACTDAGPIGSPDPAISRLLAGGAYIDIDRSQMESGENIVLNLTFLPLGDTNSAPDQTRFTSDQSALFKIHLIKVGESADTIRSRPQPRYRTYAATDQYPQVVQNLSVISPPTGQVRQEQVFIPLSMDATIDRIRIERYSGNAILIDASVFRLGKK